MKYLPRILVFIGLLNFLSAFAQTEVDFNQKTLVKALQKEGISSNLNIEELNLSVSNISANRLKGKYFIIKDNIGSPYRYLYIGRVNSCRAGGCAIATESSDDGTSEYFEYFILFDAKKTVQCVKIFNYQASHGQEITVKSWLKQFIGHDGSQELVVNKNIDAISGATISVYALTADVETKTNLLKKLHQ
jgi:Na+-translocating ferredoxin:NAD+ oxidoreductase RnfG subunit